MVTPVVSPFNPPLVLKAQEVPGAPQWLNGLMDYGLKNGDIAGSVIVVVKDGKVLFQSGYGYADVAPRASLDLDVSHADRAVARVRIPNDP